MRRWPCKCGNDDPENVAVDSAPCGCEEIVCGECGSRVAYHRCRACWVEDHYDDTMEARRERGET
jgi:hypothetical protein